MNVGENLSVANYLIVYFYSFKPSEVKDNWEHAYPLPISKESFSSSGTIELETKKRDSDEVKWNCGFPIEIETQIRKDFSYRNFKN